MQKNFLLAALLAASAAALPLNINLGAYSPALVVGDGEISFGGKADVTNLMNALEGAAVNGAAANGQAGTATPAAAQPAAAQPAAAQPAAAQPAVGQQPAAEGQATQIASLQGMGKEIAPRVVKLSSRDVKARDLSGFNAALKYATDAIKITPQIDLGTEASGVGILQRPGITAAQTPGTAKPAKAKRDENAAPKMKTTVTTMFVRGGPAPAVSKERAVAGAAVSKREPSSGIDGVNLNMAEGQVAELTFVETRAVDDDEDEDEE